MRARHKRTTRIYRISTPAASAASDSSPRERDEGILHLFPDAGVGIDELKVSDAGKRDKFNVLAGFFLFGGVVLADLVRHCVVGGAVNEPLRGLRDGTLRRRSFTIMVWNFRWRAAEKCGGSVIAQVQLPCAMQVNYAR